MADVTVSSVASAAQVAVNALAMLAPFIGAPGVAAAPILAGLSTLIPIVAAEASDLLPEIQNIITVMRVGGAVTSADLDSLSAQLVQANADFEAAAKAAGDPAPSAA